LDKWEQAFTVKPNRQALHQQSVALTASSYNISENNNSYTENNKATTELTQKMPQKEHDNNIDCSQIKRSDIAENRFSLIERQLKKLETQKKTKTISNVTTNISPPLSSFTTNQKEEERLTQIESRLDRIEQRLNFLETNGQVATVAETRNPTIPTKTSTLVTKMLVKKLVSNMYEKNRLK